MHLYRIQLIGVKPLMTNSRRSGLSLKVFFLVLREVPNVYIYIYIYISSLRILLNRCTRIYVYIISDVMDKEKKRDNKMYILA